MVVYIIKYSNGLYKIGRTENLKKRFSKSPSVVIAKIDAPNPDVNERSMHRLFGAVRTGQAETFKLTESDLETIKTFAAMENPWPVIESMSSKVSQGHFTCRHCNKSWIPRSTNPVQCPRCKRVDWKKS